MSKEFPAENEIKVVMDAYLVSVRPPEAMRSQVNIGYKIDKQSIIVHEIRPLWTDNSIVEEIPIAKCTFVKRTNDWKIFTSSLI